MVENSIQVLRSQLEARLAAPTVIVVTSAEKNDGKSLTAFSLASSFAKAGYRSIIIDANPSRLRLGHLRPVGDIPVDRIDVAGRAIQNLHGGYYELTLASEKEAHLLSRPQIKAVLDQCRQHYDYTIVDCSDFEATGLPALLAKHADAALISAREGRRCTELDSRLVQGVEESGAPVFGVVLVPKAAMKSTEDLNDAAGGRDEPAQKHAVLSTSSTV